MTSKPSRESYESLIASLRDAVRETEDTASAISRLYDLVWAIKDEKALREIQALAGRMCTAGASIMEYSTRIDLAISLDTGVIASGEAVLSGGGSGVRPEEASPYVNSLGVA